MKIYTLVFFVLLASCVHKSANLEYTPSANDLKNIKAFAGCYDVSFNFVETFPIADAYKKQKTPTL